MKKAILRTHSLAHVCYVTGTENRPAGRKLKGFSSLFNSFLFAASFAAAAAGQFERKEAHQSQLATFCHNNLSPSSLKQ